MKTNLACIMFVFTLLIIGGVLAIDSIRPANQLHRRGDGVQIRPGNQISLPSDGNGGYVPTQGSSYSSSRNPSPAPTPAPEPNQSVIYMKADLNSSNEVNQTSSKASGLGTFVLNQTSNTLGYNITYSNLSSIETAITINGPASKSENSGVLFNLPLGSSITGLLNVNDTIKNYLTSGNTYVDIQSLLFPGGEIRGQIINS